MNKRTLQPTHEKTSHCNVNRCLFGTLLTGDCAASSGARKADASAIAQQAPDAEADSSLRLEARLQPVIAVDASGQARLDAEVGMANDRFTAEVEIAKADFADLGITRGNGFRDEVVQLRVLRGGVQIFSNRLQFSRNLVNDITFETDIRGTAAPELQRWRRGARDCERPLHAPRQIPGPLISVTFNLDERGRHDQPASFFVRTAERISRVTAIQTVAALLLSRRRRFLRLNVDARGAQS